MCMYFIVSGIEVIPWMELGKHFVPSCENQALVIMLA